MAVTITNVLAGTYMKIADIVASSDADTTATVAHGLGAIPLFVCGIPTLSQALTALSAWAFPIASIDATNIVGTKLTSTGSGSATSQYRICAWIPHTSIR